MNYKFYFRKSSFKKDINNANLLLNIIEKYKPVNFLEIGVLEGATSRNVCELLNDINGGKFNYVGIDLFAGSNKNNEFTPISVKISNPLKWIYFKLILRMNPNSKECVANLLKKFKNSINLYKGYSKNILQQINLNKFDFVFLDGGHSYKTVKEDLELLRQKLSNNSIIICDDYNILQYGVKKAVDEIKDEFYYENHGRFALLQIKK